jgi:hypothetical protein
MKMFKEFSENREKVFLDFENFAV